MPTFHSADRRGDRSWYYRPLTLDDVEMDEVVAVVKLARDSLRKAAVGRSVFITQERSQRSPEPTVSSLLFKATIDRKGKGGTDGSIDEGLDGSAAERRNASEILNLSSRVDAALPFLGILAIDALLRLVEDTSSSFSAFDLGSTDLELLFDDVSIRDFARAASEIAVDFLPAEQILRRPLDSVVPPMMLLAERSITADHLPPRLLALVQRHTTGDWGSLASIYLGDVLEWPGGSMSMVKDLLSSAILWGLSALQAQANFEANSVSEQVPGAFTPTDSDVVRAIRTIATWAVAVQSKASFADALLWTAQTVALPPEVASARDLLVTAEVRSLAIAGATAYDPDAALQRVLQSVHARELPILIARQLALLKPSTLNELGDRAGITRERIRQLESKGLAKLRKAINRPENQVILSVAQHFAARFGAAAS
ncbi:MAG: hypothetical protein EXR51_08810, partial [Dehalococcoidia bacterium]|nr:hypothetical protein [Dehalococcoidia bacterium]